MVCISGPLIVDNGLVLHLDAANSRSYAGTGTAWSDLSGNGNHGTLINGTSYTNSTIKTMLFDGTNDYATVNSSTSINIGGRNITLSLWMKSSVVSSAAHGHGVISRYSGSNDGLYEILLIPSGLKNSVFFRMFGIGVYNPQITLLDLNIWYNITCVYNNGVMQNYINGVQEGTGVAKNIDITTAVDRHIHIGQRQTSPTASNVSGSLNGIQIYNGALTSAEIKRNFESTRGRYNV